MFIPPDGKISDTWKPQELHLHTLRSGLASQFLQFLCDHGSNRALNRPQLGWPLLEKTCNGSCPITGTAPMAIKSIKTITWGIQLGGCIALSRWDLRIHWGSTQCWPNHHPLAMYLHDKSGSISKIIFYACVCKYVCMYVRTYACMYIYICVCDKTK